MKQMEKRIIDSPVEIRQEGEAQFIEGAGIMFNVESQDLGGFREIILPSALDKADMTDVIVRAEHDNMYVLGRTSSGTAKVTIGKNSANYSTSIPNTTAGRDMAEYIKRGDLKGSSFAFSDVKDSWEKRDNGEVLRTISSIGKIYDMGPVFNPAYKQTDNKVALRSLEEWREKEKTVEVPKEIEEKPVEETFVNPGLSLTDKVRLLKLKGES
jgi:uncharacterized protein